ncbi:hypothetical protein VNI00_013660 [Paramarasmius palmivorus]|uniref:N-acetyl-D-glucosamine kinase n=1 Tax=Paramarasmius palmivorus TaxID=297713 RepID=A0AAW0BWF1_9AGAR
MSAVTNSSSHGTQLSSLSPYFDITRPLVLVVDAGGTKCTAAIATTAEGVIARGEAGPCNFSTIGLQSTVETIKAAVHDALATLKMTEPRFTAAWAGIAGVDATRPHDIARVRLHLAGVLGFEEDSEALVVSSDAELLSSVLLSVPTEKSAVVLVAGTGSIAYLYTAANSPGGENEKPGFRVPRRVARCGGWGHLLGDEGSGYDAGRRAIRAMLSACDNDRPPTQLHKKLMTVLGCDDVAAVITKVYSDPSGAKTRIGSLSNVVMEMAFEEKDAEALAIVSEMVLSLVECVLPLTIAAQRGMWIEDGIALVLSGSLLVQVPQFREAVVRELRTRVSGVKFGTVYVVGNAAEYVASVLCKEPPAQGKVADLA